MALGLVVGTGAIVVWIFDVRIDIPAWMWRIAIAKLTLAGAAGMLMTGATLLRYLRRVEQRSAAVAPPSPNDMLPAPDWRGPEATGAREPDAMKTSRTRRAP
jgi:hypothetical protein